MQMKSARNIRTQARRKPATKVNFMHDQLLVTKKLKSGAVGINEQTVG
jgi:hypothetical protein